MERNEMQIGRYIVHDRSAVPRPVQLRKLSSLVLSIAQNANVFRTPADKKHIEPVYLWADAAYSEDKGEFFRTSGRFARHAQVSIDESSGVEYIDQYFDSWSMRYRELLQFSDDSSRWTSGVLQEYRFCWTSESVLLSEGKTYEVPLLDREELEASYRIMNTIDIDSISEAERREIGLLETARGEHFVTREDCARLVGEMRRRRYNSSASDGLLAA